MFLVHQMAPKKAFSIPYPSAPLHSGLVWVAQAKPLLPHLGERRRTRLCPRVQANHNLVHSQCFQFAHCRNASLFEFSMCLSRACLGKMIIFTSKWRKKTRFRTHLLRVRPADLLVERESPVPHARICLPVDHQHANVDSCRNSRRFQLLPMSVPSRSWQMFGF